MATPEQGKSCTPVPCPAFEDIDLHIDLTYVPTLDEVRQAGCAIAGPDGRVYVEREGRVVLLLVSEI